MTDPARNKPAAAASADRGATHAPAGAPDTFAGGPIAALNELPASELAHHPELLVEAFKACRSHTLHLASPLSAEDMGLQSMPDASPTKWHLAHTTWFFETFILAPNEAGFAWFDETFCELFNSYYNGVGRQFPRPLRGMISRPSIDQVLAYRAHTDRRVIQLLERVTANDGSCEWLCLLRLGINHEQQHQELLVTDIKHALSLNPSWPAYSDAGPKARPKASPKSDPKTRENASTEPAWIDLPAGEFALGFAGQGFSFDNETPRHRTLLPPCKITQQPVNNGAWLAFMQDGGYQDPLLWLSEGWAWRVQHGVTAPLYWRDHGAGWQQFTLAGEQPVDPALPVAHVSYYEADAFARWADCRLPTEAEWECFAVQCQDQSRIKSPLDEPSHPQPGLTSQASNAVRDEFARVWEWTASAYLPYPGFEPANGVVGEYNGKFMINQMVLRGASGVTPAGHARPSYRNFFPAHARWQYSGLRLAKDIRNT